MARVLIISDNDESAGLAGWLTSRGFKPRLLPKDEDILESIEDKTAAIALIHLLNYTLANNIARIIKQEKQLPVLLLISAEKLGQVNLPVEADDFAVYPGADDELYLRISRLLPGNGTAANDEQIRCGELVIDLASCEVILKGEVLDLTFREYELLRFLASNRGRTFTREALLNKVWGYDYFGGDRTVDVHIRRLRTKIGDLDSPYIETVRNIGYRFRKND